VTSLENYDMSFATVPAKVLLLHNHDNSWTADDLLEVAEETRLLMAGLRANGYHVEEAKVYDSVADALHGRGYDPNEWLIFNWCEGYADRPWDYDMVVEELEKLKFIYTGSGVWSLRISRDKWQVRRLLAEAGVPIPFGAVARNLTTIPWACYPAIVKPINQHASYGIDRDAVVYDERHLRQRVEFVLDTFHAPALIEEFVDGREFQVTVWGNTPPAVLPAGELDFSAFVDPRDRIYTYQAKFDYAAPDTQHVRFLCPAMLEVGARQQLELACLQAYRALRCRDYARIDLRLRDGQPCVIDINANPDINSGSVLVMAAQAAGMLYDDMVTQIVRFAAERWLQTRRLVGISSATDRMTRRS
jgi:D-alanine-D-alanine ligase